MLGRFAWTTRSGRVSRSPVGRMKVWCELLLFTMCCYQYRGLHVAARRIGEFVNS